MKEHVVIVGGGIAGLLSALLFSEQDKYTVHVVEKSEHLGGLQKCFDYGEYGKFDYGAHNILETGIVELDALLVGLLPFDEWQVSSAINGQKRALTGLYYNGRLQENSPFIDLRDIEKNRLREYIGDFFMHLSQEQYSDISYAEMSAQEYACYLFGNKIGKEVIAPALKKLFDTDADQLNSMAMFLTPFTRICLFEQTLMNELVQTERIGSRLSFTDQKKLPSKYLPPLKTFYPKKYGIYRVIDALKARLDQKGVVFHMQSEVESLQIDNKRIKRVDVGENSIENVAYMIFSAGLYPLATLLQVPTDDLIFDKHPHTVITNILIDKPLNVGDLSYFYCYDEGYKTFRVDNYINYCSGAIRNGLYPVSVEMLMDDIAIGNKKEIAVLAIEELQSFGVLAKETNIAFAQTEILPYGFPLLTQKNVKSINTIRDRIRALHIENLVTIGILAEKNLFFESDVKKDLYTKITDILKEEERELI